MTEKHFEYRKFDISGSEPDGLNDLGRKGWELCGISYNTVGYFKRELVELDGSFISQDYRILADKVWDNLCAGNYILLVEMSPTPYMRLVDGTYVFISDKVEIEMLKFMKSTKRMRKAAINDGEYWNLKHTFPSTENDPKVRKFVTDILVRFASGKGGY